MSSWVLCRCRQLAGPDVEKIQKQHISIFDILVSAFSTSRCPKRSQGDIEMRRDPLCRNQIYLGGHCREAWRLLPGLIVHGISRWSLRTTYKTQTLRSFSTRLLF